jgi:glutathione S-transferase
VLFDAPFDMDEVMRRGRALLTVMDTHLSRTPFLAGDSPTIADIANYSYIAHASDGRMSLDDYDSVRAWLARIEALPGFVAMENATV